MVLEALESKIYWLNVILSVMALILYNYLMKIKEYEMNIKPLSDRVVVKVQEAEENAV